MARFGVPGQNSAPLAYVDNRMPVVPIVQSNRSPTTTDKKYPIWTEWRVSKGATLPALEGDFWKLVKFDSSGLAIWNKISTASGGSVLTLSDTAGTEVNPTVEGNIQLEGTSGQIDVLSDAGNNKITFSLPGGSGAVDSFTVPAGTSPVVPDATGAIAITASAGITVTGGLNTYAIGLTGGGAGIDSVAVDANTGPGTDPVLPDVNGLITVTGAQVATGVVGTNVIRSDSLSANEYTIEVQRSTSSATTDVAVNGVSHFSSQDFSVDANGFVEIDAAIPSFSSVYASGGNNVTGDGTLYTIICNAENFDIGSNYSTSTGLFTAPVDGLYLFTSSVAITSLAATMTRGFYQFNFSAATNQVFFDGDFGNIANVATSFSSSGSAIIQMSATDTARVQVQVDNGTKVVDLLTNTTFAGSLIRRT